MELGEGVLINERIKPVLTSTNSKDPPIEFHQFQYSLLPSKGIDKQ
jgi:hypothetical protein